MPPGHRCKKAGLTWCIWATRQIMAARLSVPDMSDLATLMPGRESTITVPAGQRVLVAVPDPSRTSLMISPSSTNAVALSTIATGVSSVGLQFPSGIKQPHLITWDIYGSKLHDPWYLHNSGATDMEVTVIEVMTRPAAMPMSSTMERSSLQPLKSCLPRFKPPIYPPPDDEDEPIIPPAPGDTCESGGTGVIGRSNGDYSIPIGHGGWWKVAAPVGAVNLFVDHLTDQVGAELYQGTCSSLEFIAFGIIMPTQGCISGFTVGGDVLVHIFPNGLSETTFRWKLSTGSC